MNEKLTQIKLELRELLPIIKKNYSVESIEIFGSYVKGKETKRSDLDLLVSFEKTPSLFKFIELKNLLSNKLGVKVDLVLKDSIKELVKEKILTESVKV